MTVLKYIETPTYVICAYSLKRATRRHRVSFRWRGGGLPTLNKFSTKADALAFVDVIKKEVSA